MKAIEYKTYGGPEVLQRVEVEKPRPNENEVLIKIHATTVTATECNFRRGKPFMARFFTGLRKPKLTRLGEEFAGEIECVGDGVTQFKVGDLIFGTAGPSFGANAEYLSAPADGVFTLMPCSTTSLEAAGSVDGFLTAMPFLRDTGNIQKGQKVLINGASGSVGSAAVQVAKFFGAEVTGVCSGANVELVKSVGADRVINYQKEDCCSGTIKYDLIFDTVGKIPFSRAKSVLKPRGAFLQAGMSMRILGQVLWTSVFGRKKAKIAATGLRPPVERRKDLLLLKRLMETDGIKPVIDRTYSLDQIQQAHAYVETGRKKGNVVIEL